MASEFKFKVGDVVAWDYPPMAKVNRWQNFEITSIAYTGISYYYNGVDSVSGNGVFSVGDNLQLVKAAEDVQKAEPKIEPGSKWVFTNDESMVVEVVQLNADGRPVLRVLTEPEWGSYQINDIFTFIGYHNSLEKSFYAVYKPYVEKKSSTKYVLVYDNRIGTTTYASEEIAREQFCGEPEEIQAVLKIEWSES